jgi:hypothetical protein
LRRVDEGALEGVQGGALQGGSNTACTHSCIGVGSCNDTIRTISGGANHNQAMRRR